jgi:hypothetical protein
MIIRGLDCISPKPIERARICIFQLLALKVCPGHAYSQPVTRLLLLQHDDLGLDPALTLELPRNIADRAIGNHQVGDERSWWKAKTSDPLKVAERLWSISRGVVDRPQ